MKVSDIPQLKNLSIPEKLLLVEQLWDEIAERSDQLPLPSWHAALLEESSHEYRAHPNEGASWPEVKSRLLSRRV